METKPVGRRFHILTLVVLIVLLAGSLPGRLPARDAAYVEPSLFASAAASLPVIVTATNWQEAAHAVQQLGGQVTSNLWLIDAVAATIPARQVRTLAAYPGVRSVVANKLVRTADASGDWSGWMTQARAIKGSFSLAAVLPLPATYLPDGGLVAVARDGQVLIVNADGSERTRVSLSGGPFETAAAVAAAVGGSTIYLAGQNKAVYALNADGSTLWTFATADRLASGVALGPGGTVYVADKKALYALAPDTGQLLWQLALRRPGGTAGGIAVGPDGSIYLLAQGGDLVAVSSSGSLLWTFTAGGQPARQAPLVGADGTVYLVGGRLYAINPDGSQRYRFDVGGSFTGAAPAPDGRLYAVAGRSLYALNPDGSVRFEFRSTGGQVAAAPLLSADGAAVYLVSREGLLFAVEAEGGALLWQYAMQGRLEAGAALLPDGSLVLGSEARDLVLLSPDGVPFYRRTLDDAVTLAASVSPVGDITVRVGERSLLLLGSLPAEWDGRPDAQATDNPGVWQLVYPVSVDVGADRLHAAGITGQGVTVALVDSGVGFDDSTRRLFVRELGRLFLGQADWVGDGLCPGNAPGMVQYPGYCFTDYRSSYDGYGHGSHVAGIIWNRLTDWSTGTTLGVAPGANILSVRALGNDGVGTYEDVVEAIQYIVANKDAYNVRVLNLSLSAPATVPYFADPVNRAAEQAWASGIVVIAAAGNTGGAAETITVPGNDPYVITVGAVDGNRTPGYWADDFLTTWSSTGPTWDNFIKPDVLAPGVNVVSFAPADSTLVQQHPQYAVPPALFRMSGTSMSAAVASGVAALMLQAQPGLSPDQVKFHMADSAYLAQTEQDELVLIYNLFQQGMGRLWAPTAALGEFPAEDRANVGMDIISDLAHGWDADGDGEPDDSELAYHYAGPVRRMLSDDGRAYLYYYLDGDGGENAFCDEGEECTLIALGVAWAEVYTWVDYDTLSQEPLTWASGRTIWAGDRTIWAGGVSWAAGRTIWAGDRTIWAGGRTIWAGERTIWAGGRTIWAGDRTIWAGERTIWAGDRTIWAGCPTMASSISSTIWVEP